MHYRQLAFSCCHLSIVVSWLLHNASRVHCHDLALLFCSHQQCCLTKGLAVALGKGFDPVAPSGAASFHGSVLRHHSRYAAGVPLRHLLRLMPIALMNQLQCSTHNSTADCALIGTQIAKVQDITANVHHVA